MNHHKNVVFLLHSRVWASDSKTKTTGWTFGN